MGLCVNHVLGCTVFLKQLTFPIQNGALIPLDLMKGNKFAWAKVWGLLFQLLFFSQFPVQQLKNKCVSHYITGKRIIL